MQSWHLRNKSVNTKHTTSIIFFQKNKQWCAYLATLHRQNPCHWWCLKQVISRNELAVNSTSFLCIFFLALCSLFPHSIASAHHTLSVFIYLMQFQLLCFRPSLAPQLQKADCQEPVVIVVAKTKRYETNTKRTSIDEHQKNTSVLTSVLWLECMWNVAAETKLWSASLWACVCVRVRVHVRVWWEKTVTYE